MREIHQILARRTDLSTSLVHLTRGSDDGQSASDNLKSILHGARIDARTALGQAVDLLRDGQDKESQRCVCFTETPLEHTALLLGEIAKRQVNYEPYGIALTKRQGRKSAVNPVWYVDITERGGPDWLTVPINKMIQEAVARGDFRNQHIARITPLIEQMGSGQRKKDGEDYRKEFWWEREWRHVGNYNLPHRLIVLAPCGEHEELKQLVDEAIQNAPRSYKLQVQCVDSSWSLEQMIARLAGFSAEDCAPL